MPLNTNTILAMIMSTAYLLMATALSLLGYEWITNGYGINPWVSFPLAAVCLLAGVVLPIYVIEVQRLDDELRDAHDLGTY